MFNKLSRPAAVITTIIMRMPTMDTIGMAVSSQRDLPENNLLNNKPTPIGMMIIFDMSHIMLKTFISIKAPANSFINNGVIKGANSVVIDVMVIESAKLALAKYDITFDASPLGEHPIKIIPAAISGEKPLKLANVNPSVGMMTNWLITPITTPLGVFTTDTKSFKLIEVPIPNMMI